MNDDEVVGSIYKSLKLMNSLEIAVIKLDNRNLLKNYNVSNFQDNLRGKLSA